MPAGHHTCAAHAEAQGRDALRVGALRAVAIVPQCSCCHCAPVPDLLCFFFSHQAPKQTL